MNKAAPKEPSMDEILSSIRQIIADDDVALAPRRPAVQASATPEPIEVEATDLSSLVADLEPAKPTKNSLADVLGSLGEALPTEAPAAAEDEPLALSAAQIVTEEVEEAGEEPAADFSFASVFDEAEADGASAEDPMASLVDPEDVAFVSSGDTDYEAEPEPAFEAPKASARVADISPMPDVDLSNDLAGELLEPATQAAVRHTFSKLSSLNLSSSQGLTLENMMRDMLRPMLKEWLDENLPTVVERMVEKEISRISRGLD